MAKRIMYIFAKRLCAANMDYLSSHATSNGTKGEVLPNPPKFRERIDTASQQRMERAVQGEVKVKKHEKLQLKSPKSGKSNALGVKQKSMSS